MPNGNASDEYIRQRAKNSPLKLLQEQQLKSCTKQVQNQLVEKEDAPRDYSETD